jgi:hypothetical protein
VDSKLALFRLAIWFLYFDGVAVHILLTARASIASQSNSIKTFRVWWNLNWHTLRLRLLCDGVALVIWEYSPQLIGQFIGHVIPVGYGTAALMGLAVDRVIGSASFSLGFLKVDMTQIAPMGLVEKPASTGARLLTSRK